MLLRRVAGTLEGVDLSLVADAGGAVCRKVSLKKIDDGKKISDTSYSGSMLV